MLSRAYAGISLALAAAMLGLAAQALVPQGRAAGGGVVVGSPVLTRTELRPSFVQADATVTRGRAPVLPTGVTCTASFSGDKQYGRRSYEGRFTRGIARCVFGFNNARYRGKTLMGELTVLTGSVGSAAGERITKRFSVRIGSGNTLEKPVGATVETDGGDKPKPSATTEWRGTVHVEEVDGTPGKPPGHRSLDILMTLLPGATKTEPLGWTQHVSWIATYSSTSYADPPCTDATGNPVPSHVGERTVVRGRTGERPGSSSRDYPRVGVRWDVTRSQWLISLSFFGGGGGGMSLPLVTRTTQNCGKTWITYTGTPGLQNLSIRADGTPSSTALKGRGTPTGFYNASNTSVTWYLALRPSK